jgi:hypothetical protein
MLSETIQYEKSPWAKIGDIDAVPSVSCYYYLSPAASCNFALPLERGVKVMSRHHAPAETMDVEQHIYPQVYMPAAWWRKQFEKGIRAQQIEDDPFIASAADLAEVLMEINTLAFQEEKDDFGLLRPSLAALRECLKTVLTLAREGELQRPSEISTDRNGDIRISWAAEARVAELVFPSDENSQPYLYYSSPTSYGTENDLNHRAIGKKLRWVAGGQ